MILPKFLGGFKMKHTNMRILSFVLSALMLLSLLPAGILAGAADAMNAENTIYVDQAKGSDANDGSKSNPVKTVVKAVELLEAGDVTADGYIYLVGDYTARYVGKNLAGTAFGSVIDYLPVHTRHIIVTGDPSDKPTWTLQIAVPAGSGYPDRHAPGSAYLRTNGPLTLDAIAVYVTNDKTNLTVFPQDLEYSITGGTFAGKKFKLKAGEYLYKIYDFAEDPQNSGYVIDVTDRSSDPEKQIKFPVRINDFRWIINGTFTSTANFSLSYDNAIDPDRAAATLVTNTTDNSKNITQIYTIPFASASFYGGNWGSLMVYSTSSYGASYSTDDLVVTIGEKSGIGSVYYPNSTVPATVKKVTYVIEEAGRKISNPFYLATTEPIINCDFYLHIKASGVIMGAGGLTEKSYISGKGTYNLIIENPGENFDSSLLLSGYHSLYFKGIGGALSMDFESLPAVGYEIIRIDEGDTLDLQGTVLENKFILDIVKAGENFENDSFEVIYADDESVLDFITLTEEADALGSLVYSEDDYAVYYTLDRGNVVYEKGDTEDEIKMPEASETVLGGETIVLGAPAKTVLENGKKFSGWKDELGRIYQAGDTFTIKVNGTETLTATWGISMSFVTGYESAGVVRQDLFYVPGERVTLPSDLRADDQDGDGVSTLKIVTDGGKDYVFYGWTIDGKFYHAGETIQTSDTLITATAVWVPAIYVKPTYAGGDSDGSKAKPYTSILAAQIAMNKLFGETTEEDVPGGSIVMLEDTVWSFSYLQNIGDTPNPGYVGGAQADGNVYYTNTGAQVLMKALKRNVLYTAISNDVRVLFYQYEAIYFYSEGDFFIDNLSYFTRCYHSIPRLYLQSPNKVLYIGPTVKTASSSSAASFTADDYLYATHSSDAVNTGKAPVYSKFLFDMNKAGSTAYILGGEHVGLYGVYGTSGVYTSYIGAPNTDGPTLDYIALGNTNSKTTTDTWNYYQYSGNVKEIRFGALSNYDYMFRGTWNLHFYGNANIKLDDAVASYYGNTSTRNPNAQIINLFFEDCKATVTTLHDNLPHQATIATSNGATLGDDYYKSVVSGNNTIYYYDATVPSGVNSISLKNSQVNFSTPLYVKSGADVTYAQDEKSSYTGSIYATKDTFVRGEGNRYTAVEVTDVLAGMGVEGKVITACFDGDKWKQSFSMSYQTGYDSVKFDVTAGGLAGTRLVLSDALRGQVVTDAGKELTFYGWNINGKFYDAGDAYVLGESDVIAAAVWVPAIFVDPAYAGGDSDGSRTKPFVSALDAYAAAVAAEGDAIAVVLLANATMTQTAESSFDMVGTATGFADAGKRVLLTAVSSDITLTIDSGSSSSYVRIFNSIMFDNLTLHATTSSAAYIRLLPAKDIYFGPNFIFAQPTGLKYFGLDGMYQEASEVIYKIYNGAVNFVYLGTSIVSTEQTKANALIGTGEETSKPEIDLVSVNTLSAVVSAKVDFRSGIIKRGMLGATKGGAGDTSYATKQPSGDFIFTVYSGVTELCLMDSWTGVNPGLSSYCANLSRTLVFDGYVGNVKYIHYSAANGIFANGIDNIAFINGAKVNFTNNDVVVAARANGVGSVYVESGSSYSGKVIKGAYINESAEAFVDFTPVVGKINAFNGTAWTTDTYGAALGAQIRVEAPYGIRFGFVGSNAALEAMLGQAVVEKGVLVIRSSLLEGKLTLDTENVLKIVAEKAHSLKQYNCFNGVLVDTADAGASSEAWLEAWENVDFTACAYFTLADGTVLYSNSTQNNIAGVYASLVG